MGGAIGVSRLGTSNPAIAVHEQGSEHPGTSNLEFQAMVSSAIRQGKRAGQLETSRLEFRTMCRQGTSNREFQAIGSWAFRCGKWERAILNSMLLAVAQGQVGGAVGNDQSGIPGFGGSADGRGK